MISRFIHKHIEGLSFVFAIAIMQQFTSFNLKIPEAILVSILMLVAYMFLEGGYRPNSEEDAE